MQPTDATAIRVQFESATPQLAANGDLVLSVNENEVRFHQPVVYQMNDGARPSACAEDGDHGQVIFLPMMNCGFGEEERRCFLAQDGLSTVESE